MKLQHLFSILFLLIFCESNAQSVTTFILVRHAEKASGDSKDPELSEAGNIRAKLLAAVLKDTKIDAVYSTAYKRTINTVDPVAKAKGLPISNYEPNKPASIDEMLADFPGGTILICGHSNTIPWTANYLLGKSDLKNFEDNDYDNILIVDVIEKGKVAKVTWLSY